MTRPPSRRAFLAATGSALLAGCSTVLPASDPETTARRTPRPGEPAPDGAWPGVGRDAGHAGYNPTVSGTEPSDGWRVEFEGRASAPTVANGALYLARWLPSEDSLGAALEAYDLRDGTRRWTEPIRDLRLPRPIYHRGTLYFNVGRRIVAMDAATRERYWSSAFETRETSVGEAFLGDLRSPSVVGPPVATDDGVFAQGTVSVRDTENGWTEPRGVVACFDRAGRERWRFPSGTTTTDWDASGLSSTVRPGLPAVMDGTVHVAFGESVMALDPADGSVIWHHRPDDRSLYATGLAAADGAVARGDHDHVEVLNADGTLRWRVPGFDGSIGRPAVADGTVYAAGHEGTVVAYDLETGERRWRNQVGPVEDGVDIVPAVTRRAVHVLRSEERGDGSTRIVLRALDRATGEVRWRRSYRASGAHGPIPAAGSYAFTTERTPDGWAGEGTSTDALPITTLRTLGERT